MLHPLWVTGSGFHFLVSMWNPGVRRNARGIQDLRKKIPLFQNFKETAVHWSGVFALYWIQFAEIFRFQFFVFLLQLEDYPEKRSAVILFRACSKNTSEHQVCFCQHVLRGQYLIQECVLFTSCWSHRQASSGRAWWVFHEAAWRGKYLPTKGCESENVGLLLFMRGGNWTISQWTRSIWTRLGNNSSLNRAISLPGPVSAGSQRFS